MLINFSEFVSCATGFIFLHCTSNVIVRRNRDRLATVFAQEHVMKLTGPNDSLLALFLQLCIQAFVARRKLSGNTQQDHVLGGAVA